MMIYTCGIFLISADNLILIGRPSGPNTHKWSIPKGELDPNETYPQCAQREFQEEAGILLSVHSLSPLDSVPYASGKKTLVPFYFKAYCNADEFRPHCDSMVTLPGQEPFPEIAEFKWATFDEARELLHEAQVACLDAIYKNLYGQNLEIERRWLLKNLPEFNYDEIHTISQYYGEGGRYRSTRVKKNGEYVGMTQFVLTNKKTIAHGINHEVEIEITGSDFMKGTTEANKVIFKDRYIYKKDGFKYEIDAFYFAGESPTLFILEIELKDINQAITIPDFVNSCIIKEITGEAEFRNYNLALDKNKLIFKN